MAEKAFPDLATKLNAPVRKTAYERQKEEAEAKRRREEEETAAALKEFEESFADDSEPTEDSAPGSAFGNFGSSHGGRGSGLGFQGGFGDSAGRGGLGSTLRAGGPGSLGPPRMLGRKRGHDGAFTTPAKEKPMFAYKDAQAAETRNALGGDSDDEQDPEELEKAAPRQTVLLQGLPIGTTEEEVMSLFHKHVPTLRVDKIDISTHNGPASVARKAMSAVAILGETTVNRDVDLAITALQRLYLGIGHQLSISRHLSSNVATTSATHGSQNEVQPFGAKVNEAPAGIEQQQHQQQARMRYNMAAPPPEQRYGMSTFGRGSNIDLPSTVHVKVPTDLKQLKLINKTIEGLLTLGPEFEAALTQRPEVRSEEKWAWLFDSTSIGGVYFRWRLWYLQSGRFDEREERRNELGQHPPEIIFEDQSPWQVPERRPRFERVSRVDDFLSDPEYDEDEDEYSDDEEAKRAPEVSVTGETTELQFLNPFHRAHLTHLLARLPITPATLRRGDVSRVSAFAYLHAGHAVEEISDVFVANVVNPLSLTDANPENHPFGGVEYVQTQGSDDDGDASDTDVLGNVMPSIEIKDSERMEVRGAPQELVKNEGDQKDTNMEDAHEQAIEQAKEDTSSAKLIGLYILSDVLHGCASSGVRNAWKYKNFIEKAIKEQGVFEQLGRLERDMKWGKVRADRWKSRVMHILDLWSSWSSFSSDTMKLFIETFKNPPLTEEERVVEERENKEREERRKAQKSKAPIVQRHSEPRGSEEPVSGKEIASSERTGPYSEAMEVDEKPGHQARTLAAHSSDDGDNLDVEAVGMFGSDGADSERPPSPAKEEKKDGSTPSVPPKVVSRGSKRPSTRDMLGG